MVALGYEYGCEMCIRDSQITVCGAVSHFSNPFRSFHIAFRTPSFRLSTFSASSVCLLYTSIESVAHIIATVAVYLPGSIIGEFRVVYIVTCRLECCGRAVGLMVDDLSLIHILSCRLTRNWLPWHGSGRDSLRQKSSA